MSNLISNAIKYQKTYAEHLPEVIIATRKEAGKFCITINDNGEGVAPQNQARVFEMFYRGSQQSKGSGLGLYIAREAAHRMKGEITFESEYGKGTTFTLTLPL